MMNNNWNSHRTWMVGVQTPTTTSTLIIFRKMLTCALKAQDKELNIVNFCWNVCIQFNFWLYNK